MTVSIVLDITCNTNGLKVIACFTKKSDAIKHVVNNVQPLRPNHKYQVVTCKVYDSCKEYPIQKILAKKQQGDKLSSKEQKRGRFERISQNSK